MPECEAPAKHWASSDRREGGIILPAVESGEAYILSIVLNIVAGIIVGMRDRDSAGTSDQRDREIGWFGDRVGQAFLVIGGVGALALTMLGADYFWIGNTLFLGFALSMLLGSVTRIIAYRRGF